MRDRVLDRLALQSDLRRAVDNGELSVHYQPIVAHSGRVLRFEALLRWAHPSRGAVPPDRFIPFAEACGLIVPLGAWMVERACTEMQTIRQRFPAARLAVNVSTRQLYAPGFERLIRDVLWRTSTEPETFEIEITETALMTDVDAVLPMLLRLRATGISISLDDFGTGYSSLSYLARLPLDTLKIDASFVRDIAEGQVDGAIARKIVELAHSLQLRVIAEGVETEIQRSYLEHVRCDELQGFLFSRPLPSLDWAQLSTRWPGGRRVAAGA